MTALLNVTGAVTPEFVAALNENFAEVAEKTETAIVAGAEAVEAAGNTAADRTAVADMVATAAANMTAADAALLQNGRIGRLTAPVSGSSLAHATYHYDFSLPFDIEIVGCGGYGINGGGTIQLKVANRVGTTNTQDGANHPVNIPAGAFTRDKTNVGDFTPFIVKAGQKVGLFAGGTTGSNQKLGFTANTADLGGLWSTSAGGGDNTTSYVDATLTTNIRIEFYLVWARVKPTAANTEANEKSIDDNARIIAPLRAAGTTRLQYHIGRDGTPNGSGGTASALTRAGWQRSIADTTITAVDIDAGGAGLLYLSAVTIPEGGGVVTPSRSALVEIPTGGVQRLTLSTPLQLRAGEYLEFFSDQIKFSSNTANGGAFWSITGNLATWTTGAGTAVQRMEIGFVCEIDAQGLVGTQHVRPGEQLAQADRVAPTDVTVMLSMGESLSKGTQGEGFMYTAVNNVEMFAQGVRAARSGTLSGGFSNSGGTASKVAAEERLSNAGNSYAYDNESGANRGNTGRIQLADSIINLAFLRSGVNPANNTIFVYADAHGGYRIDQYNYNARWGLLGGETARACKALYDAEGKTPKCLIVLAQFANNSGQGIFLGDDSTVVNLTAATKEAFKARLKHQIRLKTQELQSIFGQADQIHWLVQTVSAVTKGTGNISGLPRDGIENQAVVELSRELSNFHVLGADFETEKTPNDNVHSTALGYTLLSLMADRAAYEIMYENRRPSDMVMPLSAKWSGSTVKAYYWSVNPLTIDTTNMTAMTNLGVAVNVNGSPVSLAGNPVIDNAPADGWNPNIRALVANLSSPPASSSDVVQIRLGLDYGRPTNAGGRTDEAVHNFRTTATAAHMADGSPLTVRWWLPAHATIAMEV